MKLTFYIAADSFQQANVKALRDEILEDEAFACTARWIDAKLENYGHPVTEAELRDTARANFSDIENAMFLIMWNPLESHRNGTGGRHVEMGYAIARYKYILYVGEVLENVFHRDVTVSHVVDHSLVATVFVANVLIGAMKTIYEKTAPKRSDR